ncbi:HAD family hydrolase [Pseudobutyrivibrio sp.]|uniref:HAD family hydrolase n=1 Tax=Pseudobutyrivibrio sp. TaxID=2014367 RepID=UPI001DB17718|nr:HAD-IA family hydrolase [Pseudobutyrivibrio sp.]MBE5911643.1 HAD family hydrolase [Pseudobutyrivibrio sp.]
MKYDTILFDLDGTLLYTLEDLTDGINHTLKEYGLPTHPIESVRRFVGNGLKMLAIRALPEGENYEKFDQFFKDFVNYYNGHNRIKTKPYPGITETTEKLASMGIKMAIVTNKGQTATNSLMDDYFKPHITIAIGDDGKHARKPDPEPINMAMDALGITDKSRVLYVGDSDVDATTAENSGLDYVLCTYGFRDMDDLKDFKPVAFINNIEELLSVIA